MKYFFTLCIWGVMLLGLMGCKDHEHDYEEDLNSRRITQITEYNTSGELIKRETFSYKDDKLITWHCTCKNQFGEMQNSWKMDISYSGRNIIALFSYIRESGWSLHREYIYTIFNGQIHEVLVSRHATPSCVGCWKYKYRYSGIKLVEWDKFIRGDDGNWREYRKDKYFYSDNKLVEYKDFVDFDNTGLKLDYKKKYSYVNGRISGWQEGIFDQYGVWQPSRKTEFTYDNANNLSVKNYYALDVDRQWKFLGVENYYYDEFNYLIEKTAILGNTIRYEYEPGHGNAAFLMYTPDDIARDESHLKSALAFR